MVSRSSGGMSTSVEGGVRETVDASRLREGQAQNRPTLTTVPLGGSKQIQWVEQRLQCVTHRARTPRCTGPG